MEIERFDEQQLHSISTPRLVRLALDEARLLVRAEVFHAKEELRSELKAARASGILLGAGVVGLVSAVAVLLVALGLLLPGPGPLAVALVGAVALVLAVGVLLLGFRKVPRQALPRTLERLKQDLSNARERLS